MQNYELLFILPGTLAEDEVPALVAKVNEALTESGVENIEIKDIGKSRLAYPIKHIRYGYFHLAHFEAEGTNVEAVKAKLGLVPELLRHLITKHEPGSGIGAKINFGSAGSTNNTRGDEPRSREREVANVAANVRTSAPTPKVKEETKEAVEEKVEEIKEKKETKTSSKKDSEKFALEDIDKKLDEILDLELDKV